MPKNLRRITGFGDLHFITFCCYQRRPFLDSVRVRTGGPFSRTDPGALRLCSGGLRFHPEHVHLLLSESGTASPAKIVQSFKQRVSGTLRARKRKRPGQLPFRFPERSVEFRRFWQRRYYDFNVHSRAKMTEKLHYMHGNPVRAKLVKHPGDWPWSSWCHYYRAEGLLRMDRWE